MEIRNQIFVGEQEFFEGSDRDEHDDTRGEVEPAALGSAT